MTQPNDGTCRCCCRIIWICPAILFHVWYAWHLDNVLSQRLVNGSQITGTWHLNWNMILTDSLISSSKIPQIPASADIRGMDCYWVLTLDISSHNRVVDHNSSILQQLVWSYSVRCSSSTSRIIFRQYVRRKVISYYCIYFYYNVSLTHKNTILQYLSVKVHSWLGNSSLTKKIVKKRNPQYTVSSYNTVAWWLCCISNSAVTTCSAAAQSNFQQLCSSEGERTVCQFNDLHHSDLYHLALLQF